MEVFYKTEFLKLLLTNYKELYRNEQNYLHESTNIYDLEFGTDYEKYIKRIANRWWLLRDYLITLNKIAELFTKDCPENDFEEIEWWQYNYENFVIRLSATLDQISKLVNEVYSLELCEKDSNWSRVRDKIKSQNRICSEKISLLQVSIEEHLIERHIVVHRGGLTNTDIKEIDNYYFDKVEIIFFGEKWFNEKEQIGKHELLKLNKKLSETIMENNERLRDVLVSLESDFEKIISEKKQCK